MSGVSDSVLEALARALQLDGAEGAHLFDRARALRPAGSPRRRRAPRRRVRPSIQHVLDGLPAQRRLFTTPAWTTLGQRAGYALYSDMFSRGAGPPV